MKVCQNCGIQNPDTAAFCSECGNPLPKKAAEKLPAKTMLATPAPKIPAATEEKKDEPPPSRAREILKVPDAKKTIMGMPSLVGGQEAASAPAVSEPAPAVKAKAAKAKPLQQGKTEKAKRAAHDAAGKTMLGVSPLAAADVKAADGKAANLQYGKTAKEEKPVFEPLIETPVMSPGSHPPTEVKQEQPQAPAEPEKPRPRPDSRPRTEAPAEGFYLEKPSYPAPSTKARLPSRPPSVSLPSRPSRIGASTMLMMKKAAAIPRWLIVLIIVVVVGGAGLGYVIKKYVLEPMKPRVTKIAIRQNPDFQSVDIDLSLVNVDKAAALMIKHQKFKIEKSRCLVNLSIGPVRLGNNDIEAVLLDAKGNEIGAIAVQFELAKFWQPQLQTLDSENPVVGLYFQTLPDARLTINGELSPGEGPGKFLYQKTIKELMGKYPPADEEKWKLSFDYELKSKGRKPDKGTVKIEIPAVKLQVDRPADGARVTEDKIECTGKTDLDAEVKINASPVDVSGGKFAATLPLADVKEYEIKVEAYSPKRGPMVVTVKVERVEEETMDAEIDEYRKDVEKDLTWEKLARDPTSYKGKKGSFEGRIFNIRTEKGVTAFQMLVSKGCPEGARCTLVATFRGETSAGEQSLATVLGEVMGVQMLQTATGSKFEAPQIEAKYVIPQEQKKEKKKKKKGK